MTSTMQLKKESYSDSPVSTEEELMRQHLTTEKGALWMELGCGPAKAALALAQALPDVRVFAYEIDEQQHAKNVSLPSCPKNLTFGQAGMQDFPTPDDASVDAVIMLKSLHHVPYEYQKEGFTRIHKALKPGGRLFISEPVFDGDFNEILRIFHDEQAVRSHAFDELCGQVDSGAFELLEEVHFQTPMVFPRGFADFEARIINSTFNNFSLTEQVVAQVRDRFQRHVKEDGSAEFLAPMRVDVFMKKS